MSYLGDANLLIVLFPVLILQLVLMIVALIDVVKIEKTNGPKWMWVLIIIIINIIGPVIYFIFGRRQS